jgi:pyruvate dehydrogenase E2 component (dihydrolipoamide acetyltransferase)
MAIDYNMPKLAMAMNEGTISEWLVESGEYIEKGKNFLVVETEKVTFDLEAPESGYLYIIMAQEETVPVETLIAKIAESKEEWSCLNGGQVATISTSNVEVSSQNSTSPVSETEKKFQIGSRVKVSPLARALAKKNNIDFTRLTGTGPGGRIVKKDILSVVASKATIVETIPAADGVERIDGKRVKISIPFRGMRKVIADHMVKSLAVSAQLTGMSEIDMTEVLRLRKSFLQREKKIGVRISYTDILVFILARTIKSVPQVNTSLIGNEIKVWKDINIGIAVGLQTGEYETGLIVPVVKNADRKSLTEISHEVKELALKARNGELTADDLSGGTITLSNTGTFVKGWGVSTPIINQPEAMMVQPGGISERPVVINGEIVIRPIMTMSITFDHRILDGNPVGRFSSLFQEYIENPELLHL